MIFSYLILFVLSVLISISTGQSSNFVIPVLFYSIGIGLIYVCSDTKNKKRYIRLFSIAFLVYLAYAVACFIYMTEHNYSCLLVTDTITAYIPWVEDFMKISSLSEMLDLLYGDVTEYSHAGILLIYWTMVGKFATLFGFELYFNLQVSVLFLSAFVPVFLCRLLVQNNVKYPNKLALVYVFCSVFCFYATLILRDAPIALFYMIAFSYLFSKQSAKKNIVIISMTILSYLIRPQMGMFLLLFYFVSFVSNSGKLRWSTLLLLVIAAVVIGVVLVRMDVAEALERNAEYAVNNAAHDEDALVHTFNKLPPVISELTKILYIQISPIPSWAFMGIQTSESATNNMMGFPRMIAVLYNYILLGFILFGVFRYKRFSFSRKHTFVFLVALLFLALQTSSTEQRRLMICYPILFLFGVMVSQRKTAKNRKTIIIISVIFFMVMQVAGALKY
jgi:hypothetical protein